MLNNYETIKAGTQKIFNQISRSLPGELQDKELHEVEESWKPGIIFRFLEIWKNQMPTIDRICHPKDPSFT